jgi:hypothetical protein
LEKVVGLHWDNENSATMAGSKTASWGTLAVCSSGTLSEEAFDILAVLSAQICEPPIARNIFFRSHGIHQPVFFTWLEATRNERFAHNHRNSP